jgi:hypothetical protein
LLHPQVDPPQGLNRGFALAEGLSQITGFKNVHDAAHEERNGEYTVIPESETIEKGVLAPPDAFLAKTGEAVGAIASYNVETNR